MNRLGWSAGLVGLLALVGPISSLAVSDSLAADTVDKGKALLDMGDVDRAISVFFKAVRFDPKYAKAYYGLGFAHGMKGNRDKAIAYYKHLAHGVGVSETAQITAKPAKIALPRTETKLWRIASNSAEFTAINYTLLHCLGDGRV
jgi:tetratricopeptide (TPR) repeat protein